MKVIDRIKQSYSESLLKEYIDIYVKYRIPNIAAAETYYLTLTFFPLIIVMYTLLGTRYSFLIRLLNNAKNVMTEDTYETVAAFLGYVARNTNDTMFIAAVVVLITSAAAAFRSVHVTIGKMQGMIRFPEFSAGSGLCGDDLYCCVSDPVRAWCAQSAAEVPAFCFHDDILELRAHISADRNYFSADLFYL